MSTGIDPFAEYKPLSTEQIDKLWEKAVFVFDANVLLNFFRYSPATRLDLEKVLSKIERRIWIPYHVGLEYHRNRHTAQRTQVSEYEQIRKKVGTALSSVQKAFSEHRTAIAKEDIDLAVEVAREALEEAVASAERAHTEDLTGDKIPKTVDDLFAGCWGEKPTQEQVDEWQKRGSERYALERPPGYKDSSKDESYWASGIKYERKYGDVLVWEQLLAYAKSNEVTHVILVTDDRKEDWWLKEGGRTIGLRPELIYEICAEADVEGFHMYTSSRFLEFAEQQLDIDVDDESLEEASRLEEEIYVFGLDTLYALNESPNRDLLENWRLRHLSQGIPKSGALTDNMVELWDVLIPILQNKFGEIQAISADEPFWVRISPEATPRAPMDLLVHFLNSADLFAELETIRRPLRDLKAWERETFPSQPQIGSLCLLAFQAQQMRISKPIASTLILEELVENALVVRIGNPNKTTNFPILEVASF
ncbi:MAG: hypothetical protein RhofKO_10590 [Rhodothermales bacterium]